MINVLGPNHSSAFIHGVAMRVRQTGSGCVAVNLFIHARYAVTWRL